MVLLLYSRQQKGLQMLMLAVLTESSWTTDDDDDGDADVIVDLKEVRGKGQRGVTNTSSLSSRSCSRSPR